MKFKIGSEKKMNKKSNPKKRITPSSILFFLSIVGLVFRYDWKNVGEDKARTKIVAAVYYKDWDWVIGAGTYEDEIFAVRDQISKSLYSLLYIMVILSVIIYVIAIIISTRIAKRISTPITNAAMIAQYIGRGDLDSARKLLD